MVASGDSDLVRVYLTRGSNQPYERKIIYIHSAALDAIDKAR